MAKIVHIRSRRSRLALAILAALVSVSVLEVVPALRELFLPLQKFTATLAYFALKATGLQIAIDDILLTHPDGFRVAISYGCTPLIPAIFLGLILTVGLSLSWRERTIALASGIILVTLVNLFRVAALYCIGVYTPGAFVFAHEWLGQIIIVLGTAVVACYWINTSITTQSRVDAL